MINKFYIYISDSFDPYINLAIEEHFLFNLKEDEMILYFYRNEHSIIIGRNQNPWAECLCREFEESGGKLARRISGGGAVYHDKNNLNFSFIINRKHFDIPKQLSVITNAMRFLGFNAYPSGRNDILIDERKFSGNAFCFKKQNACHHGTIMINTDVDTLTKYLTVSKDKISSKGISSVRSRVINLKELKEDIDVLSVMNAATDAFSQIYGIPEKLILSQEDISSINNIAERNKSFEWKYGSSPEFDIEFSHRFSWGGITVGLKIADAKIVSSTIYSDALDVDTVYSAQAALAGSAFISKDMSDAILSAAGDKDILSDIASLIISKNL